MEVQKSVQNDHVAVKITLEDAGAVVGRAYLYLIKTDVHVEPYGYLEDVFVEESKRGQGVGTKLIQAAIDEARVRGFYKIIGTTRHEKSGVHAFYEGLGFENHGLEFRMDLVENRK